MSRRDFDEDARDVDTRDTIPAWLARFAEHLRASAPQSRVRAQNAPRPAAVLVLLIDGPDGPRLLLTERAATLSNYPGRLVFPGGAVEPGDDGPAATALREAAEEVGLRSESVHIVGALPPVVLRTSGFSVTPVLAWCTELELTGIKNPDEVASIVQISLDEIAQTGSRAEQGDPHHASGATRQVDGRVIGPMTAAIIDLLLDHR